MKKIFTKSNFWAGFIGLFIGIGIGIITFSALVPSGADMIRIYRLEKKAQTNAGTGDVSVNGTSTIKNSAPRTTTSNPYIISTIVTEKQFVENLKLQHEATISMATQALKLNLHPEVKTLAKNIISTQMTEVKMMKDWLTAWWK